MVGLFHRQKLQKEFKIFSGLLMQTYINEEQLPFPFCPGCGHSQILKSLDKALVRLNLDPRRTVIVTDIGCAGLSDRYFLTNSFHGLHGRSITYATGIKLANPDLKVIVLIGDGGCGIGGHHLINAARRNIGITTLVFNNLNYGMTGGEHSVTTPIGGITSTTLFGQIEQPFDICSTAAANGSSFVARSTTFDKNLTGFIYQAILNDGFSLIDIWELCTAYFVPKNKFSKKALEKSLEEQGFSTGIIHDKESREFSKAYKSAVSNEDGKKPFKLNPLRTKYPSNLKERTEIVISGSAGSKISSAAALFGHAAVLSGLWVTQRDDYPVTVKTGHSISELIISPEEIKSSSITIPDLLIILFQEGFQKSKHLISQLTKNSVLILNADLPDIQTHARKIAINFMDGEPSKIKKEYWGILTLAKVLKILNYFPQEAFIEAITVSSKFSKENMEAVKASECLTISS